MKDNNIAENKFLIQVAFTDLKPAEAYMLNNFWTEQPKEALKSYKLKVGMSGPAQPQDLSGTLDNKSAPSAVSTTQHKIEEKVI